MSSIAEPSLQEQVEQLGILDIQYHLFLCADQTKPKCCEKEVGLQVWDYLKRRITELELSKVVFRTKANCLRLCLQGPILVVYPHGVWYHSVSEVVIDRILQEHIMAGQIVAEFVVPGCHGKFSRE